MRYSTLVPARRGTAQRTARERWLSASTSRAADVFSGLGAHAEVGLVRGGDDGEARGREGRQLARALPPARRLHVAQHHRLEALVGEAAVGAACVPDHLLQLLLAVVVAEQVCELLGRDDAVAVAVEDRKSRHKRRLVRRAALVRLEGGAEKLGVLNVLGTVDVDEAEEVVGLLLAHLARHRDAELVLRDGPRIVGVDPPKESAEFVNFARRRREGDHLERHLLHIVSPGKGLQRLDDMHVLLHLFSDVRTVVQQRRRLDPRVGERLRGAQPLRRLLLHEREAKVLAVLRDPVPLRADEAHRVLDDHALLLLPILVVERPLAREEHEGDDANRPHVDRRVVRL
mmetsp:Transcript_16505/g.32245  ORF Transcript_16505/g.32245 Transcript_16505/m.32245 type:complete len:343 (-) Transcript_16505:303-1331(-)